MDSKKLLTYGVVRFTSETVLGVAGVSIFDLYPHFCLHFVGAVGIMQVIQYKV